MQQLEQEDEAREAAKVAAAEIIDWFASDDVEARQVKAMIFGGRL